MLKDKKALYAAFKAKDSRFDGRFFVAIASTGIYCRPVCRARLPKPENCTFYATAAEAEQAGYRPCLLCWPEVAPGALPTALTSAVAHTSARAVTGTNTLLAHGYTPPTPANSSGALPGYPLMDASAMLAQRAARMLEESCCNNHNLEDVASQLQCSSRHLRRVFTAHYNVSPMHYIQTCRLLLAKNLLTNTTLSILEVALASGFGSQRRFNDVFKQQYRLSPSQLRKHPHVPQKGSNVMNLALGYRPPYPWDTMLNFLSHRAIAGVEVVHNGEYSRTVTHITGDGTLLKGWITVGHRPQKNALFVAVSASLLSVLPQILGRVRHLFDLQANPQVIYDTLQHMNTIRPGLCVLGTRVPGSFNAFEIATRAVLGQQITVKAASTLASRLVTAFGNPIDTDIEGLTHTFPGPETILSLNGPIEEHLGPLGIIASRAKTIYALAHQLVAREITLDFCPQPEAEIQKLMRIRGIGKWTAHYIAMRALEWPDAFLETDAGVKKALSPHTPKEMLHMAEAWRPWRSYATVNLWNSL